MPALRCDSQLDYPTRHLRNVQSRNLRVESSDSIVTRAMLSRAACKPRIHRAGVFPCPPIKTLSSHPKPDRSAGSKAVL